MKRFKKMLFNMSNKKSIFLIASLITLLLMFFCILLLILYENILIALLLFVIAYFYISMYSIFRNLKKYNINTVINNKIIYFLLSDNYFLETSATLFLSFLMVFIALFYTLNLSNNNINIIIVCIYAVFMCVVLFFRDKFVNCIENHFRKKIKLYND